MPSSISSSGKIYDLVGVGFGAATLSVAIALHERDALTNTIFLEYQSQAGWRPFTRHATPRMGTSFMNDLITLENPRSKFTFLNYLHATNQLVAFTNVAKMQPSREIYAEYLRWCAGYFQPHVAFEKQVIGIDAVMNSTGLVEGWNVLFEDVQTGGKSSIAAKQILCAVGLQPKIPQFLTNPDIPRSVVHSSAALEAIPVVLGDKRVRQRIAIIGNSPDAAEVFSHLHGIHGDHQVHWFTEGAFLKGSDDTPFVIEETRHSSRGPIPEEFRMSATYPSRPKWRQPEAIIPRQLMETIYDFLYDQRVANADPQTWKFQVRYQTQIFNCDTTPEAKIILSIQSLEQHGGKNDNRGIGFETAEYDLVIAATGYDKCQHERILRPLQPLLDGPAGGSISIDIDSQVNFRSGVKRKDVGVWLLHSLADTNEQADDSFYRSLSQRSARIVQSMLKQQKSAEEQAEMEVRSARL